MNWVKHWAENSINILDQEIIVKIANAMDYIRNNQDAYFGVGVTLICIQVSWIKNTSFFDFIFLQKLFCFRSFRLFRLDIFTSNILKNFKASNRNSNCYVKNFREGGRLTKGGIKNMYLKFISSYTHAYVCE